MTRDMLRNGYTGIAAMETGAAAHVTLAGRNARGELETFEIDAAALAKAAQALSEDGGMATMNGWWRCSKSIRACCVAMTRWKSGSRMRSLTLMIYTYAKLANAGVALDDTEHSDHAL